MAGIKRLTAKITVGDKTIDVDNNLISTDFDALDRGDLSNVINWGIYSNRGSLSFVDRDNLFYKSLYEATTITNSEELNSEEWDDFLEDTTGGSTPPRDGITYVIDDISGKLLGIWGLSSIPVTPQEQTGEFKLSCVLKFKDSADNTVLTLYPTVKIKNQIKLNGGIITEASMTIGDDIFDIPSPVTVVYSGEKFAKSLRNYVDTNFGVTDPFVHFFKDSYELKYDYFKDNSVYLLDIGIYASFHYSDLLQSIGAEKCYSTTTCTISYNTIKSLPTPSTFKSEIYLTNDRYSRKIATFDVENYTYNDNSKEVNLELVDSLVKWQDIEVDDVFPFDKASLYDIVNLIKEANPNIPLNMSESAQGILSHSKIYCPLLRKTTIWDMITQICEAGACCVFCDENGIPTIDNPLQVRVDNIKIDPKNIISIIPSLKSDKTAIESVEISQIHRQKHFNSQLTDDISVKLYTANVGEKVIFVGGDDGTNNANTKVSEHYKDYIDYVNVRTRASQVGVPVASRNTKVIVRGKLAYLYYDDGGNIKSPDIWDNYKIGDKPLDFAEITSEDIKFNLDWDFVKFGFSIKNPNNGDGVITDVKASIVGDFFTDEGNTVLKVGEAKKPYQLPSNDLIQTENIFNMSVIPPETPPNLSEYIANRVLSRYSNGVECIELECLLMNYYDADGNLLIDASGTQKEIESFKRYDIVTPYVLRKSGVQPYGYNVKGEPKSFIITGIKYSYKGILRQKLYLQEYVDIN